MVIRHYLADHCAVLLNSMGQKDFFLKSCKPIIVTIARATITFLFLEGIVRAYVNKLWPWVNVISLISVLDASEIIQDLLTGTFDLQLVSFWPDSSGFWITIDFNRNGELAKANKCSSAQPITGKHGVFIAYTFLWNNFFLNIICWIFFKLFFKEFYSNTMKYHSTIHPTAHTPHVDKDANIQ